MKRSSVAILVLVTSLVSARAENGDVGTVVVPLSSAFTLDGFGRGQSDHHLFSEYVLHVARPGAGAPMRISDWVLPHDHSAATARPVLASAERTAPLRRVVPLPVAVTPAEDAPIAQVAASQGSSGFVERWAARLPAPDFTFAREKVQGALSGLGGRVTSLVPRIW
ncbi:MAG: hypothetical protein JWL93_2376 [Hyphomicrobiales bacterium]|nr:hypothetical protein [Hyphomicrobiales bacterium]